MKSSILFLLALVILIDGFTQKAKTTSSTLQLERKLDSLSNQVEELHQFTLQQKNETVIKIDSLNKVAEILDLPSSPLEKWAAPLIALLTIVVSSFTGYLIAVKQIRGQQETTDVQKRLQESIAQDQLQVARAQIAETSKMALAQVRANNVSQARITWIQDLRNILCEYIGEIAIVNFQISKLKELKPEEADYLATRSSLDKEVVERVKHARELSSKIRLFLNAEDNDHQSLEKLIPEFAYAALKKKQQGFREDINVIAEDIILVSKKILKDTWNQAKKEGQQ